MIARIEVDADTMDKNIATSLRLAGYTIKEHINREGVFPYIDTYICQKIVDTATDAYFSNKILCEELGRSARKGVLGFVFVGGVEQ